MFGTLIGLFSGDTLPKEEVQKKLSKGCNVEYSQVLKKLDSMLGEQWPHDDSAQLQKTNLPPNLQIDALSGSKRSRTFFLMSHNLHPVHSEPSKRRKN